MPKMYYIRGAYLPVVTATTIILPDKKLLKQKENAVWNANKLVGKALASTSPSDGQVLTWNATSNQWEPRDNDADGETDHGSLTGLSDDDHPQYQLRSEKDQPNGYPGLDEDGYLVGPITLTPQTSTEIGTLEKGGLGFSTTKGNAVVVGDNTTLGGKRIVPVDNNPKPKGMVRMVSIKTSGNVSGTIKSTTGYIGIRWWDGSVEIIGDGVASNSQAFSKAIPTWSSAWSGCSPKEIFFWPATSNVDPAQNGNLTHLSCTNNALVLLDVTGVTTLTELDCSNNNLIYIDLYGLVSLTSVVCDSNDFEFVDFSNLTSLTSVTCANNDQLITMDIGGLTSLTTLFAHNNSNLTSLDLTGLSSLQRIYCVGSGLTSLRAVGVILTSDESSIAQNNLDSEALDQFYTDLATDSGGTGTIDVTGNPGTSSDNPTIATDKGYTITG